MGLIEKEKVIKRIQSQIALCKEIDSDWISLTVGTGKRILELLDEQEKREQAICKEICDFIRHACSTDTDDDKDYVCYVIQNCFKHFCADGERKEGR